MASVWNKVREVVKLRYVVVGTVGPSAVYWYFRNEAWKQTLKDADELISAEFRELREISARAKASTPVMAAIHQLAWEQLPQRMGADEFGSWLVHSLKGNPPGLGDDGITAGYHDSSEITGLDPWDIHACLRTCESDPTGKLDLRDLLIASSALVKSENPFERIDLAWKVIDRSESGNLTFSEFSDLAHRMEITGHFDKEKLLRQTQYLPPEWSVLSGEGIAMVVFEALDLDKESQSVSLDSMKTLLEDKKFRKKLEPWYYDSFKVNLPGQKKKKEEEKPYEEANKS